MVIFVTWTNFYEIFFRPDIRAILSEFDQDLERYVNLLQSGRVDDCRELAYKIIKSITPQQKADLEKKNVKLVVPDDSIVIDNTTLLIDSEDYLNNLLHVRDVTISRDKDNVYILVLR